MNHIKSLKLIDWCFIAFILVYFTWCLWSLSPRRLAWYDEAVFASITDSFIHGKGFAESCYGFGGKNAYGPVYFLLTALSTSVFGFNSFGFRLVNMAALFGGAFLLLYLLRLLHVSKSLAYIGVLLFLTDMANVWNAYSARMELVAVFFVILEYVVYILNRKKNSLFYVLAASFAFSLAALTTPRSIVVALPLFICIAFQLLRTKQWGSLALYVSLPIIAGGGWILYEHGSFAQCMVYYFGKKDFDANGNFQSFFMGGNCRFEVWQLPLLLWGTVSIVASITMKRWGNFIFIAPILLFFTLVADNGSYTPYGHLFLYLIVMVSYHLLCRKRGSWHVLAIVGLLGCFAVNIATSAVCVLRFVAYQPALHEESMELWVHDSIAPNSVVLADDAYFYALRKNNCTFRRLSHEWYQPQTYHKKLEEACRPGFVLKQDMNYAPIMDLYQTELVADYKDVSPKHVELLQYLFQKLGIRKQANCSGKLYRIIRPEVSTDTGENRMANE